MIKERISTISKRPGGDLRLLLCDTTGNVGPLSVHDEELVSTPIQCLDRAVDGNPDLVLIRFGEMPNRQCETLLELSAVLKRNSHTRHRPVLALLHSKHRQLIENLEQAGVDFVKYVGEVSLDSNKLRAIINDLRPDDGLERHLAVLCPFLHYSKIDSQRELTICGAYLDRLVLGGRWLREVCDNEHHLHCEYYLNPRIKS